MNKKFQIPLLALLVSISYAKKENIAFCYAGSSLIYYSVAESTDKMKMICNHAYKRLKYSGYHDMIPAFSKMHTMPFGNKPANVEVLAKNKITTAIVPNPFKKFYTPMSNIGIKLIKWKGGDWNTAQNKLKSVGKMTGKHKRAKEVIEIHNYIKDEIAEKTDHIPYLFRKIVLQITGHGKKIGLTLYDDLTPAGVKLPNGMEYTKVARDTNINYEQLLKMDPEVIVIFGNGSLNPKDLYNNKALSALRAVKNRTIYRTPKFANLYHEPLTALKFPWIEVISYYPMFTAKRAANFRNTIKTLYKKVYNVDLNPDQIDDILDMKANKISKNYVEMFGRKSSNKS